MSIPLTINGTTFNYPQTNDQKWGPDATGWAQAVTNGMLQKSGGLFQLLAEVDFGTAYGIKTLYLKSRTANPAAAGQIRLANTDTINFNNAAHGADLPFGAGSTDNFPSWNGIDIANVSSAQTFTNKTYDSPIITGAILGPNGSAGAPTFSFSNGATYGMYYATNTLGFSANGVVALSIGNTQASTFNGALVVNGDQASSGLIVSSSNLVTIGVSSGSLTHVVNGSLSITQHLTVTDTVLGNLNLTGLCDATAFVPSSSTVPSNGLYLPTGDSIGWATASTARGAIDPSGKWTIGTAAGSQTHAVNGNLSVTGTIAGSNLSGTNTGDVTLANGTNGLTISSQVLTMALSSTSTTGSLTSTDWNTFNGKQAAGNYITALTGDITASGPGSVASTLATVNSNVGSFGSSTAIPTFTVNGKGLITAASTAVVIAPAGTLSGTTLNSTVVSSSLTSVGTIATGVWNGTAIADANLAVSYLKADGTRALTGNWSAGAFQIDANSVLVGSASKAISQLQTIASDGNMIFQTNGSTQALKIGTAQNFAFNGSTDSAIAYWFDTSTHTATTGAHQVGFYVKFAPDTTATSDITAGQILAMSSANIAHTFRVALSLLPFTLASGATSARDIHLLLTPLNLATDNACISDITTITGTGNSFMYQSGTLKNVFNGSVVCATAARATNATDGFLYLPTCAGAPSGTPTTQTGTVAHIYDSTNNQLYVYNGAWKKTVALT